MKADIRRKGDTALSELAKTYELVRDELTGRLDEMGSRIDEIDARRFGRRAYSSARDLRSKVEGRVRPAQRRRRGLPVALIVLGVATLGIAWLLYDRRRRDMIQGRITQLGVRAQEQAPDIRQGITGAVDGMMGKVKGGRGLDEAALQREVEAGIAGAGEGGGMPDGLQVAVEGRTVYLRGTIDSATADQAAARAQQVEGVAAVVNLTTVPQAAASAPARPAPARRAPGA